MKPPTLHWLCLHGIYFIVHYPTGPLTFLEPQYQEMLEFYVVQESRATDYEAAKLWKGRSGTKVKSFIFSKRLRHALGMFVGGPVQDSLFFSLTSLKRLDGREVWDFYKVGNRSSFVFQVLGYTNLAW